MNPQSADGRLLEVGREIAEALSKVAQARASTQRAEEEVQKHEGEGQEEQEAACGGVEASGERKPWGARSR